ncbi:hypothetical protein ACTI_64030 [Actinoplanes sp. OR16]|nr:hypothetical protein ACTI_64030 [Actinoplanes sp. OR16]
MATIGLSRAWCRRGPRRSGRQPGTRVTARPSRRAVQPARYGATARRRDPWPDLLSRLRRHADPDVREATLSVDTL